ncbi:MAG: C10 family peptidase [Prevotella sp.]|nr:C10 family peptidase [Prevotella sp.]
MKKTMTLAILAFCFMAVGFAAPISKQKALNSAKAFLQKKGLVVATGDMRMAYRAPLRKGVEEAAYYVFNAEGGNGFVVVSGDDRTMPILGYADRGSFDAENMPANMKAWLEGYEVQIRELDNTSSAVSAKVPKRGVEASKKPIPPLLTCTWNQDEPYNLKCPTFVNGTRCVTGCVATAMAQVMYYHRANSVSVTQQTIDAYECSRSWNVSGVTRKVFVEAIPEGTTLDWDDMIDNYTGNESEAQKNAVAVLLAACGASVSMDYADADNHGSSASNSLIPNALKTYFGYQAEMKYCSRSRYTIDAWDNLIFDELANNRPVIYDGQSTGGGHAFVVDGYDGDGLYHVNWGWGGMCDGYFVLSVMNPNNTSGIGASSTSDGYSMGQGAVIGVQPQASEEPVEEEIQTLTASSMSVSGNTITASYSNRTTSDHIVRCGFGVVDENGNVVLVKDWGYAPYNLRQNRLLPDVTFDITAYDFSEAGLIFGEYQLVPICLMDDEEVWKLCDMVSPEYVEAQYAEDGTVTLIMHATVINLVATDFQFPSAHLSGATETVNLTLKNNGDEFNGNVYFFVNGTQKGKTGVALRAGKSTTLAFSFVPPSAGTYSVSVSLNSDGSNPIGSSSIEIGEGSTEQNLAVSSFIVENANPSNNKVVYGTTLKGTAVIQNNASSVFAGNIRVFLMVSDEEYGNFSSEQSTTIPLVIPAGSSSNVELSFSGLSFDKYYWVTFRYGSDVLVKLGNADFNTYNMEPGLVIWNDEGVMTAIAAESSVTIPATAVAVDLSGAGVTSVTINSNPNTLYYMGTSDTEPSGLEASNVVKGTTAETITLTDGKDFYVPKTFTASEINFTMTPDITTNGKGGWMTLALPFAITKVTRGDTQEEIDWFRSKSDSDKNFWMKSFTEVDGTTALFGYADHHEANLPYIVAFPGNKWGEEYDLSNTEIVFSGENARILADARMISSTSVWNFVGSTIQKDVSGVFYLNSAGSSFAQSSSVTAQPFRAYFVAKSQNAALPPSLSIGSSSDTTTELLIPVAAESEAVDIYDLHGMKVRSTKVRNGSINLNGLSKGVYIVKGKKVVIK